MADYPCDQITIDDLARLRNHAKAVYLDPGLMRWHVYAPALLQLTNMAVANPFVRSRGDVLLAQAAGIEAVDPNAVEMLVGYPVVVYRDGEFGGWQGNALALEETRHGVFFTLYADGRVVTWTMQRTIPKPPSDDPRRIIR